MHGKSPHGSFGLKCSLIQFKSIKSLKYLKWNEKSLSYVFMSSLLWRENKRNCKMAQYDYERVKARSDQER